MKWFKRVAIIAVSLIVAVAAIGLLRAPVWSVEVAEVIEAPTQTIHEELVDFRRWGTWSGWDATIDPDAEHAYSGTPRGAGSVWAWKGPKMGRGRLVMTREDAGEGIWLDEAIESDELNAQGSITYERIGDTSTRVTWRDEGRLPFVLGGLMASSVESGLREHFGAALKRLKTHVESRHERFKRVPKTEVHGSVHALIKDRDWGAKLDLAELSTVRTVGVGVLKDLSGLVTFVGGGAWMAEVSAGRVADRVTAEPTGEAAMMAVAQVDRWRASAISKEVSFRDIGKQIAARISQVGLPTDRPIPFRLRGDIVNAVWHVVDGQQASERLTQRADLAATSPVQTRSRIKADVVGFYAPNQNGIITDYGASVVAHIVVPIERVSGHLDDGMIQPMSVLLLPDISE